MRKLLQIIFLFIPIMAMASGNDFVSIRHGELMRNGIPYRFIGVNYWYGPLIAVPKGGDRARMERELDQLKQDGVTNVRAMVGVDGVSTNIAQLPDALQKTPGAYDKNVLAGLDYFLAALAKRHMTVVLFLNNNWEWTGGFAQYLAWTKNVPMEYPEVAGWNKFEHFISQFYGCEECQKLFNAHIHFIVNHVNEYTHVAYRNDPTIMAWELANEPRPDGVGNKTVYKNWIYSESKYIKSVDHNHLVTTGTEGEMGTENDINLWKVIHESPDIDYATIHVWAKNWGWINFDHFDSTYVKTMANMKQYVREHAKIAQEIHKPLVIEEIGFPRDTQSFNPATPATYRNEYFKALFDIMLKCPTIQGINLWAFGGEGKASNDKYQWRKGDEFTGDPPMEQQGLNSVFSKDQSTLQLVKTYNQKLSNIEISNP
ncbi:glycoside hydrolase 5 family protein [Microbacter margulisiae]|uniref:mannan endo-1,4-beta-mannosidase n=1 Tax=Microbacter margulisiae TaxID=1350067 RepID=A0A7W5DRF7_9PORP|nr:cellulase family glycosylhydrolase [Microbacter margulisiae]MBB3187720.1 mannan endo-1,4-beta-mannosidase [Microbacter margulisiae]